MGPKEKCQERIATPPMPEELRELRFSGTIMAAAAAKQELLKGPQPNRYPQFPSEEDKKKEDLPIDSS